MADFLLHAAMSNLIFASLLALIAWLVQRCFRSITLSNFLWSLVLVKLVTPPLFSIPIVELPSITSVHELSGRPAVTSEMHVQIDQIATPFMADSQGPVSGKRTDSLVQRAWNLTMLWKNTFIKGALAIWIVGAVILSFVSGVRVWRFHCLLCKHSKIDQRLSLGLAHQIANQFSLKHYPVIWLTSANLAPFVWWMSGRSVIFISKKTTEALSEQDLESVLAHEMSHLKRRDHWFRWLEWTACITNWWNPIMWLARRQLRISEELACDELVLKTTQMGVHHYASSLLNVAELLSSSTIRPPVVASAINSGGCLEGRLKTMLAGTTKGISTRFRLGIVGLACCLFPLGLVSAQDFEAVERRLGGGIEAGELTIDQAKVMLDALRSSSYEGKSKSSEASKEQSLQQYVTGLKMALMEGKISNQEFEEKLRKARAKMTANAAEETSARNESMDRQKRYLQRVTTELELAVLEGLISRAELETKLQSLREQVLGRYQLDTPQADNDQEAMKRRYEKYMIEIEMAVKAGELSKAAAEEKLYSLRQEMFEKNRDQEVRPDHSMEEKKRKFDQFMKEVEQAVANGAISKEEALQKISEVKEELFGKE